MDQEVVTPEASQEGHQAVAEGYRPMAADREGELEAEEWTEQILFVPE